MWADKHRSKIHLINRFTIVFAAVIIINLKRKHKDEKLCPIYSVFTGHVWAKLLQYPLHDSTPFKILSYSTIKYILSK